MISKILSFQLLCLALVHANPVPTSTAAPVETTHAPVETTHAPVEATAAPVETTATTVETTAAPVETTAATVETTAAPVETTATPQETTAAPVETTHASVKTTAAPLKTSAAPVRTTHAYSTDAARDVAAAFPRVSLLNTAIRMNGYPEDHSGESDEGVDEVDDTGSNVFQDIPLADESYEDEGSAYKRAEGNCEGRTQNARQK